MVLLRAMMESAPTFSTNINVFLSSLEYALRLIFWPLFISFFLTPLGAISALAQNPVYDTPNPQRVEVSILAISSSIKAGGGNQEIYLADVRFGANTHQMAKLVDAYSRLYSSPIQRFVLVNRHPLRMTLVRDSSCDSTGNDFFLAPGDSNIFDPSTRNVLKDKASEEIPCFKVIHEATRLAK
jgi:hypothetical protein